MAEPTDGLRWVQIRRRRDLSATAKLVWRTIERICLHKGQARVSERWLAEDTGCGVTTVHRALTQLRQKGLVELHPDQKGGRGVYKLTGEERYQNGAPGAFKTERKRYQNGAPALSKGSKSAIKTERIHGGHDNNTTNTGAGALAAPRNTFPETLDTPEFREAWTRWEKYRRELRKPLTQSTKDRQLAKLTPFGADWSVRRIEQAIERGWRGLVFPDDVPPGKSVDAGPDFPDALLPPWCPRTTSQANRRWMFKDYVDAGVVTGPDWWKQHHPMGPAWLSRYGKEAADGP